MHFRALRHALALVVLGVAACKDSPAPAPSTGPRSITALTASNLSAPVGTSLTEPLAARVKDELERPVRGVRVVFSTADGMATLDPAEATSDANGEVRTTVTLGTTAGRIDVLARIAGSDSSTRFTIIATALAASAVDIIPSPMWLHAAGETGRLVAYVGDRHGNAVGSSTITWRSLDESVATVTSAGQVLGVTAGATARIEARSEEGFLDTALVSVADPATRPCTGAVETLAPGGSIVMDPRDGACIRTSAAAEYLVVPFFASEAPNAQTDALRIVGTGIAGSTVTALAAADRQAPYSDARPMPDDAFDYGLRLREERELAPLAIRSAARRDGSGDAPLYNAVPATVREGDYVSVNASPVHACSFPSTTERNRDMRIGRVVAITSRAIVVADTTNPPGGFTDAEYRRLGVTFDTLVAPMDEQLFGTPGDIDGNERSVIFYTGRVNEISTSSDSYVGGFFWSRDLLRRDACGTSNVAEIFYMLVPDPEGRLGAARTKAFVEQVTVGTLAHEYQHLINASRRFANPSAEPIEATWLNEGLSHIAEEMLFYRTAGLQPRANVGGTQLADATVRQRYFDYQHNNTNRFERWLTSPSSNTPYGLSSALATRGAAWAFLRYLADRHGTSDGDLWYRLVNNEQTGIENVEEIFGIEILTATRDWAVAMYTDDFVQNPAPEHRFPSWNYRSVYPAIGRGTYALELVTFGLANNSARSFLLRGGGAAYYTFRTNADLETRIMVRATTGTPQPAVKATVVRIR